MGSAAGKQAQGSEAFSNNVTQATSPRPQSRTHNTHQGRSHSTPQNRQPDFTRPRACSSQDPPGHSGRNLSIISLDEDEDEFSMVCESCSANFTIFKRKNRCLDCSKFFCNNCMRKEPRKCCKICHMFKGSKNRSQMMQFKVKDLRQYLAARNINTVACREKGELVDLVVQYLATQNGGAFMVTVNNLEDATSDRTSTTPEASQPESSRVATDTQDSPGVVEQGSDGTVRASQEPPTQTHDEPEIRVTRNTWVEGSSSSDSETEHSPVTNLSSPADEPSIAATTTEESEQPPARHRTSISDLKTVDEIADLSVRQLKEILTLNFINYKGCVERWELEERVRRLYGEREGYKIKEQASAGANTDSKETIAATGTLEPDGDETCKICMDSPIDCVLLECGHMVTCTKCGKQLAECPMCRQYIIRAVHVFRS